jgi:hypothetical protein
MNRERLATAVFAAATLLVLAGCGGEDAAPALAGSPGSDDVPAAPEAPSGEPPVAAARVRFIALGDSGTGSAGQYAVGAAIARLCAEKSEGDGRAGCDLVLGFGDNIYENGPEDAFDVQFEDKFEQPFAPVDLPFYMVLGNHDNTGYIAGDGTNNARGDIEVAYHYRDGRSSERWQMPARYYQFHAGGDDGAPLVSFFALDSNPLASTGADSDSRFRQSAYGQAQLNWLVDAMAGSSATWRFAFAHHPYLSNGEHGNAGNYDGIPGDILPVAAGRRWQSFLQQGVCDQADMYFAGHDHDLQLLAPVSDCGRTRFMVSGAAGKTRSLADAERNDASFQQGERYGFFWVEARDADAARNLPARLCIEAYSFPLDVDADMIAAMDTLDSVHRQCFNKAAPAGLVTPSTSLFADIGDAVPLPAGVPLDASTISGPLLAFRNAWQQLMDGVLARVPAQEGAAVAPLVDAGYDMMASLDALAQAAAQQDPAQLQSAIENMLAVATQLEAIDGAALSAPFDQLDDAFAAFAAGMGNGEAQGDTSADLAFLVGPLVQLAANLDNIVDAVEEEGRPYPVLSTATASLSALSRGFALSLEALVRLEASESSELFVGAVRASLLSVADATAPLQQAPLDDGVMLLADGAPDLLLTAAREVTEQLDQQLLAPADTWLDSLSFVTGMLVGWFEGL